MQRADVCGTLNSVAEADDGRARVSQQTKLLEKLKSKPKDFRWDELEKLLRGFGYKLEQNRGSRRKFVHEDSGVMISLHKPHPGNELKSYQIADVLAHLKQEGSI